MGKLSKQSRVMGGYRECWVSIRLGRSVRLPRKRADEELQAFFLGLCTLENPTIRVSSALGQTQYRTYKTPSIFTPCLWAAVDHPGGGIVTRWGEKLEDWKMSAGSFLGPVERDTHTR